MSSRHFCPSPLCVIDTDGRLLMVRLPPTDNADSTDALQVLGALKRYWPWGGRADSAYGRRQLLGRAIFLDFVVKVRRRLAGQQGGAPLPRRWVVKRTVGWMMQWRRLVSNCEMRLDVSIARILVAAGSFLSQRLLISE